LTGRSVDVIGAGLAGITAAIRLAERGASVTIHESDRRLGGKAGSITLGGTKEDHGYHVFPMWYVNAWALIRELGIESHFEDAIHFHHLNKGAFPSVHTVANIQSPRWAWRNLRSGVLPFPEAFLFAYAILDLAAQPYRYRSQLDQVTVTGFLRSRFYRTEGIGELFHQFILKGLSVPSYLVSAMTVRNVMRYWLRRPEPMQRILKGNMEDSFIAPLAARLCALGCVVKTRRTLRRITAHGGRVTHLEFEEEDGSALTIQPENVVLALSLKQVVALLNQELFAAAPKLAELKRLSACPMAALSVYFRRKIPEIPNGHVNMNSRFGLSFIDVSQVWPDGGCTVLNVIASDFAPLEGLPPDVAKQALLDDLRSFLPFTLPEEIVRSEFQSHDQEPLFLNTVGAWTFRPQASTELANLFLAGDYCRNKADLVSMEGAITTGLLAASALQESLVGRGDVVIREPESPSPILMTAVKWLGLPLAALAKLIHLLGGPPEGGT
jgi:protoporphyrinogen oxidase